MPEKKTGPATGPGSKASGRPSSAELLLPTVTVNRERVRAQEEARLAQLLEAHPGWDKRPATQAEVADVERALRAVVRSNERTTAALKAARDERNEAALWLASQGIRALYKAVGITRNSWVKIRRDAAESGREPTPVEGAADKLRPLAIRIAHLEERGRLARGKRDLMLAHLSEANLPDRELSDLIGRNRTLIGKRTGRHKKRAETA